MVVGGEKKKNFCVCTASANTEHLSLADTIRSAKYLEAPTPHTRVETAPCAGSAKYLPTLIFGGGGGAGGGPIRCNEGEATGMMFLKTAN